MWNIRFSARFCCGILLLAGAATLRCEPNAPGTGLDATVDATVDAASDNDADVTPDARPDVSLLDAAPPDAHADVEVSDASVTDGSTDGQVGSDANCPDGGPSPTCPPDMTLINGAYCIDLYEASRPDATALYAGVDDSFAVSAPDRYPWWSSGLTSGEADLACQGACKRLCTADEWQTACRGPAQTVYAYGNDYEPATCNGIDTRCNCTHPTCAAQPSCPYAFCWSACGGMFHVDPTGYSPGCVNGFGLFDMSGNVWEVVDATDMYPFRGGAFNCANSQTNHRCDYVPTWNISAKGFRCCRDPL